MKNLLLISGTGRNCGKTTLACSIIEAFKSQSVTAIKICPHFHPVDGMKSVFIDPGVIEIHEELQSNTGKDSSRMLNAGAEKVFYVQVKDNQLNKAWDIILNKLPSEKPVICESGRLSHIVEDHLHLLMIGKDKKKQASELAHFSLAFEDIPALVDRLRFDTGKWFIS
ncbi:MAG: hypothetical protein CVU05_07670 [Bacteroidetes bacterium HGW-Bacteroidetes-21]|jgi:hypothetical protein|nr:MAG: hypothetical protein CVU05_07670 [Bacteroidetes bacterium HGW-Bacteroidetes-21]